jgi:Cdc6-like AAA superfamily ATPase
MGKYKINSRIENGVFVVTESYKKLLKTFKTLKTNKGRIIHVIGAPGTGKSANIYAAIDELELNVYDAELTIKDVHLNSEEVFKEIYMNLKKDLGVNSKEEVYQRLSKCDAVLFADRFHDSHLIEEGSVGFSVWTDQAGFKATKFYMMCIAQYLKERKTFNGINIILQTAWRVYIRGKKYDIFSDLGIVSRAIVFLMGIFFEVVEISYSHQETLKIVKKHVNADNKLIEDYIDEYGYKPRFICNAMENDE